MKLIPAATDFSRAASAAVRRAAQLAADSGARLVLLHVARQRPALKRIAKPVAPAVRLRNLAARIRARHGIAVEAHLAGGSAHKQVTAFAQDAGADLIVLGLRRGFIQDFLGTATAQRVRRRAAVPVLAVARASAAPYERILVATDFSARSAQAARRMTRTFADAALYFLHVSTPTGPGRSQQLAPARAKSMLERFAARAGLQRASLVVRSGSAAAAIREFADTEHIDLIVLTPAEKTWFDKRILVDVVDAVLSHAERDVLIFGGTA